MQQGQTLRAAVHEFHLVRGASLCRQRRLHVQSGGVVGQQQVAQPEHQDRRPGGRGVN